MRRGEILTGAWLALVLGLVVVLACLMVLVYDSLGSSPLSCRMTATRALLDGVAPGSLLLSRHVNASTRRPTVFNTLTSAGEWYHVGLVARRPGDGALFVLDCMADGPICRLPCAGHQPLGRGGPRLIDIMHYMLLYSLNPGICALRCLEGPGTQTARFRARVWTAAIAATRYRFVDPHEMVPKLIEGVAESVLGRRVGRRGPDARHGSGVFCSELCALVLMQVGVLDPSIGAAAFAPWSFCRPQFDAHVTPNLRFTAPLMPDVFRNVGVSRPGVV